MFLSFVFYSVPEWILPCLNKVLPITYLSLFRCYNRCGANGKAARCESHFRGNRCGASSEACATSIITTKMRACSQARKPTTYIYLPWIWFVFPFREWVNVVFRFWWTSLLFYERSRFVVYRHVIFIPAETTRKYACMNNKRFLPLIAFDVRRTHPNLGLPVVLRGLKNNIFRRSSAFSAPS